MEVCRTRRNITIHILEQEPDQHHEEKDHIDMVNINSVHFNNKHLVLIAKLKTSSNQAAITIPYKVDIDID